VEYYAKQFHYNQPDHSAGTMYADRKKEGNSDKRFQEKSSGWTHWRDTFKPLGFADLDIRLFENIRLT